MNQEQPTQPAMFCRKCGYDLFGLSESRCPECGRAFDPSDPRTYRRRLNSWPRRHWVASTGILMALFVCIILFTPLGMPLAAYLAVSADMRRVHNAETQMQLPANYLAVAKDLALYCQSLSAIGPLPHDPWYMWLPPSVSKFGPHYVDITSERAYIEMGGGFYHYGYVLEKDKTASTAQSNTWVLQLLSEGQQGVPVLTTVNTSPDEQLSRDQFIANATANYDREIASGQYIVDRCQQKIAFLLDRNMPAEARAACRQMLKTLPGNWWANLTVALVDATDNGSNAEARLRQWVEAGGTGSRYLCLAHYYRFEDRPEEAAAAADKAAQLRVRDELGEEGEVELRAASMAIYLYDNGRYPTVIRLCEAVIQTLEKDDGTRKVLVALKRAAAAAQEGKPKQPALGRDDKDFDLYHVRNGDYTMNLEKLRGCL